jgi:hypothetical protein
VRSRCAWNRRIPLSYAQDAAMLQELSCTSSRFDLGVTVALMALWWGALMVLRWGALMGSLMVL